MTIEQGPIRLDASPIRGQRVRFIEHDGSAWPNASDLFVALGSHQPAASRFTKRTDDGDYARVPQTILEPVSEEIHPRAYGTPMVFLGPDAARAAADELGAGQDVTDWYSSMSGPAPSPPPVPSVPAPSYQLALNAAVAPALPGEKAPRAVRYVTVNGEAYFYAADVLDVFTPMGSTGYTKSGLYKTASDTEIVERPASQLVASEGVEAPAKGRVRFVHGDAVVRYLYHDFGPKAYAKVYQTDYHKAFQAWMTLPSDKSEALDTLRYEAPRLVVTTHNGSTIRAAVDPRNLQYGAYLFWNDVIAAFNLGDYRDTVEGLIPNGDGTFLRLNGRDGVELEPGARIVGGAREARFVRGYSLLQAFYAFNPVRGEKLEQVVNRLRAKNPLVNAYGPTSSQKDGPVTRTAVTTVTVAPKAAAVKAQAPSGDGAQTSLPFVAAQPAPTTHENVTALTADVAALKALVEAQSAQITGLTDMVAQAVTAGPKAQARHAAELNAALNTQFTDLGERLQAIGQAVQTGNATAAQLTSWSAAIQAEVRQGLAKADATDELVRSVGTDVESARAEAAANAGVQFQAVQTVWGDVQHVRSLLEDDVKEEGPAPKAGVFSRVFRRA